MAKRGGRSHARRWIVGGILLAIAAGSATAVSAIGTVKSQYRTAVATKSSVSETLSLVGTVVSSNEHDVSFPISGQVQAIPVVVGQQVKARQTLAWLTSTSLASQVGSAQSTLASAEAQLANDEATLAAQSIASATPSPSGTTPSPVGGGAFGSGGTAALQLAVRTAEAKLTHALDSVDKSLQGAELMCLSGANPSPNPTVSHSPSSSPAPSTTPSTTPSATPSARPSSLPAPGSSPGLPMPEASCSGMLHAARDGHSMAIADMQALVRAQSNLVAALKQSTKSAASSAGIGGSTAGASRSTSAAGLTRQVTAQQITADQAAVQAAQAHLDETKQNLAAASLVSPIDATVAQINITPGSNESASSPAQIVLIGNGVKVVNGNVDATNVGKISRGQPAIVTPDGSSASLPGHVASVGLLSSSTSSTTYPVSIALDSPSNALTLGSNAQVTVTVSQAANVVTVPTSAVHSSATGDVVTLLNKDGTTSEVQVAVGTVGATFTEIADGVSQGDIVVLANVTAPLPTNSANPRGFGGGGFIFRGGGPGGAPGGGPGGGARAGGG